MNTKIRETVEEKNYHNDDQYEVSLILKEKICDLY